MSSAETKGSVDPIRGIMWWERHEAPERLGGLLNSYYREVA